MSVAWSSEPGNPGRKTWVVDEAPNPAELERRLNHLDEEGFRIWRVYQILIGMEPAFVIVAFRRWSRFAPWLVAVGTAVVFILLCFLRRLL